MLLMIIYFNVKILILTESNINSGNQGLKGEKGTCPNDCFEATERITRIEHALEGFHKI